jgi:hypothetical protein
MIGVGKIKQYGNVLDKPLNKGKTEVYLSPFLDLLLQMLFVTVAFSSPILVSFNSLINYADLVFLC